MVEFMALKTSVSSSAQGFLGILIAAVIPTLTTVRTTFRTKESDVIACSAPLDVDGQFCPTFVADGLCVVDAFTG
jgi:aspartate-semialdehyde dehydrogenase